MNYEFTKNANIVLENSNEEKIRLGHNSISVAHLLLGIIRNKKSSAAKLFKHFKIDTKNLKNEIEQMIGKSDVKQNFETNITHRLQKQTDKIIRFSYLESMKFEKNKIGTEHLLLAILLNKEVDVSILLNGIYKLTYNKLLKQLNKNTPSTSPKNSFNEDDNNDKANPEDSRSNTQKQSQNTLKSKTPTLDSFGKDLTQYAINGKLDPVVGRKNEIERVSQILSRRKKNNPILVGEPGVGKSAIAEGLALRIVNKQVSRALYDKRIISLDLASMIAGTKYRGQFEERMKALMNELEKNDDVILFIDEIHTVIGAGGATGSLDASNMLKPALARGEIQVIGATTIDEYRQYIEKDGALERRFQKIQIEPTSIEESIEILNNIKDKYENHHYVKYTDEAIRACVTLTERYITDHNLPDKAIDALDEVGARIHLKAVVLPDEVIKIDEEIKKMEIDKKKLVESNNYEEAAKMRDKQSVLIGNYNTEMKKWDEQIIKNKVEITDDDVAEVVSQMTGIPVTKVSEKEIGKLKKLTESLAKSVIGQEKAIEKVVKAIQRNRIGLKDPNKPIGSFIFLGPTGVGKTQLAKELAKELFDTKDALVRIDMSEYMEKFAVTRLIGSPPGFIGYEEGGQLTEKVKRNPYSIVLLDEIEKAHPDIFNLLLQMLDEGFLTDSLGRKIDFRNTIIIMTSNIGARQLQDFGTGVGFATKNKVDTKEEETNSIIQAALKKVFAPEFLNRIDEVIMFNSLTREYIRMIIDIELDKLYNRIALINYKLQLSDKLKDFVAGQGFDEKFGARPLNRAIQKYIEDPISEKLINQNVPEFSEIHVDVNENDDIIVDIIENKK